MRMDLLGLRLRHSEFGIGTIIDQAADDDSIVTIQFSSCKKRLSIYWLIENGAVSPYNSDANTAAERNFFEMMHQSEIEKKEQFLEEIRRRDEERKREIAYQIEKARKAAEARMLKEKLEREERKKRIREKENKNILLKTLHTFGFEGFLHTTEVENLKLIVESGYLKSRELLRSQGFQFIDRANEDVINHTTNDIINCCRFYYWFRTPTNYRAGYKRPVILVFDERILLKELCFKFSDGNAASRHSNIVQTATEALKFNWHDVFERGYQAYNVKLSYGESTSEITRKRNAEFLYPVQVSVMNIVKIYFKEKQTMEDAKSFCSETLINKFVLDRSKF